MNIDIKQRFVCFMIAISIILSSFASSIYAAPKKLSDTEETELIADTTFEDTETEITSAVFLDENTAPAYDAIVSQSALCAFAEGEYQITVYYDSDAGIPNGAELAVTEARPEKYLPETAEALGWSDDDYILYTKFFDITIVKDGVEIEPQSPVTVTAELLDVDEGAETLQVVHFDEDGVTQVESSATDEAEVTFEAESFSVYGFGSVLHRILTEDTDAANIMIYGSENVDITENTEDKIHEEGFDTLKVFDFDNDNKLWVKASPAADTALPEGECYALYAVEDNAIGAPIIEDIAQNSDICAIDANAEGLALMHDTGFRRLSFDLQPNNGATVTLDGMMPKNAEAEAKDVTKQYENDSERFYAAFDISIINNGKEYQPAENKPIYVEIEDVRIDSNDVAVLHISDNGAYERITDIFISNGKIGFNAYGFSVYEIVSPEYASSIIYEPQTVDIHYVSGEEAGHWAKVTNPAILTSPEYKNDGFYISSNCIYNDNVSNEIKNSGYGHFAMNSFGTSVREDGRRGLNVTEQITFNGKRSDELSSVEEYDGFIDAADDTAALYYFSETGDNRYYIYCLKDPAEGDILTNRLYVAASNKTKNDLFLVENESEASKWTLGSNSNDDISNIYLKAEKSPQNTNNADLYWNNSRAKSSSATNGFATWTGANNFNIWYKVKSNEVDDPFGLDDKTYSIINSSDDNNTYALNTTANGNNLVGTKLTVQTDADTGKKQYSYAYSGSFIPGYTFHSVGAGKYKISVSTGSGIKYIKMNEVSKVSLVDEGDASEIEITAGSGSYAGKVKLSSTVNSGGNNLRLSLYRDGTKFTSVNDNATNKVEANKWQDLSNLAPDAYALEGKTYGLAYFSGSTSTSAEALVADNDKNSHTLVKIITRSSSTIKTRYVDQSGDISMWNFKYAGDLKYKLYTNNNGVNLYMHIASSGISFTDLEESDDSTEITASKITITPGTGTNVNKMQFSAEDENGTAYYLYYDSNEKKYMVTSDSSEPKTWLNCLDPSSISATDSLTYTAKRISCTEAESGKKYVIYTRVWNDDDKRYDFYAIDYDGELVPVYASGGKIQWVASGVNALEWEFTAYKKSDGKTDNGYYELYNPYSEKYIVPRRGNSSYVLADKKVGLNMEGRRNGDYYTTITAWDNYYYQYAGLMAESYIGDDSEEHMRIASVLFTGADVFYFAEIENDDIGELHTVDTINNYDHGIVLKMIDFEPNKAAGSNGGTDQKEYITDTGDKRGLLTTNLDSVEGYPVSVSTSKNLRELFSGATESNRLFLESVYNSSGYFEYDSCQNFATLLQSDGSHGTEVVQVKDEQGNTTYKTVDKFTVYNELGTTDATDTSTTKHGLFLPYNKINIGNKSTKTNQYTVHAKHNDTSVGMLDPDNPRYGETLYSVGGANDTDYYFGMEMDAEFVQTPSGLDTWGHDVIFEFTGDDDFWLYVDGELVLDLGGIHSALEGKVNFRTGEVNVDDSTGSKAKISTIYENIFKSHNTSPSSTTLDNYKNILFKGDPDESTLTLKEIFVANFLARNPSLLDASAEDRTAEVKTFLSKRFQPDVTNTMTYGYEDVFTDYSPHKMRIFYMERGAGSSNLHMRFNLSAVTPGNVILKKELEGDENVIKNLDLSLLQYPFRIEYKATEDGDYTDLTDTTHVVPEDDTSPLIEVVYQGTTEKVKFAKSYTLPENGIYEPPTYNNVFFINPTKAVEIKFPDNAIYYRITECAVNTDIYSVTSADGSALTDTTKEVYMEGSVRDFSYDDQVSIQPNAAFINKINSDVVKPLNIMKRLYDSNGELITADDDQTLFQYRLSVANYTPDPNDPDILNEEFILVNTRLYYVHDSDGYLCIWNPDKAGNIKFERAVYNGENYKDFNTFENAIKAINEDETLTQEEKAAQIAPYQTKIEELRELVGFYTSINGSISNSPTGYTVEVPGFIPGTKFKVEERATEIPVGYALKEYRAATDQSVFDDDSVLGESTYIIEEGKNGEAIENIGTVKLGALPPSMFVVNKRGSGISVSKSWSDASLVQYHGDIYTAVYLRKVEGDPSSDELVKGTIRQWNAKDGTDSTYLNYFFDNLGGYTLKDYIVKEIKLKYIPTDIDPYDGAVKDFDYDDVDHYDDKIEVVNEISVNATLPKTNETDSEVTESHDYLISYTTGKTSTINGGGEVRTGDIITNTRKGGVVIRLFKWDSDIPLANGKFVVTQGGNVVGEFASGSNGLVVALYGLEEGKTYVITETAPPNSFEGMAATVQFKVNELGEIFQFTDNNEPINSWAKHTPDNANFIEYIDIYNKPFTINVKKTDGSGNSLAGAIFQLFKQVTAIGAVAISPNPVLGFEELVTDGSGNINLSSPNGERTLGPGTYYLKEKEAPIGFENIMNGLHEYFTFTISNIGKISTEWDVNDDSVYKFEVSDEGNQHTITVKNPQKENTIAVNVSKIVNGNLGNKVKNFKFTLKYLTPDKADEEENWVSKSFYLKHGETVPFAFEAGTKIKLYEDNEDYVAEYKLNDAVYEAGTEITITGDSSYSFVVTNTRSTILPTGIAENVRTVVYTGITMLICIIALFIRKRKYQ